MSTCTHRKIKESLSYIVNRPNYTMRPASNTHSAMRTINPSRRLLENQTQWYGYLQSNNWGKEAMEVTKIQGDPATPFTPSGRNE